MPTNARDQHRPRGQRDRGRLISVIGLGVFAVVLAGASYVILDRAYEKHLDRVEESIVWKADETAWDIAEYLDERRIDVLVTAAQKGLPKRVIDYRDGVDSTAGALVQDRLDIEREFHAHQTVAVFEADGTPLMWAGLSPEVDAALAAEIARVAEDGGIGFVESVQNSTGWQVWWICAMPSYNGETLVLGESVDISSVMLNFIERHERSFGSGEIAVLDRQDGSVRSVCANEGVTVTSDDACKGMRLSALGDIGADGREVLSMTDCSGVESLGAVVEVAGTGWRVMTKLPRSEVIDEVRDSHWTALGIDLMLFTVATMGVVLIQRGSERRAEQAQSLSEIREALASQDRFLANMSHELRTPLNSIMGFTSIMLSGMTGPLNDEQTKQLGMVDESAKRLLVLVNDVLDLSKLKSGKREIIVSEFPVSEVVAEACDLMGPISARKNVRCDSGVPVGDIKMQTDREMVERVVLNLLSNAVKFTDEGFVSIDASYDKKNDTVHFVVRDSGCGISPDELARVTEEFTQVVEPTGFKPVGTGLGLAISRRMAEGLGGALMAESTPGEGSTFTFVVPRVYKGEGEVDV